MNTNPTIALYTCNFGNYRNEFQHYLDCNIDKTIDCFLFTDNTTDVHKLKNWNICHINTPPDDEIMHGSRWASKQVKFILPEMLKKYDIIVWIDNKIFKKKRKINNITYEYIIEIINKYPSDNIFNIKHFGRKTPHEEIQKTIDCKLENKEEGLVFLNHIKDYTSSFLLPDTCIIIRKNNTHVNEAFEYCFELLKHHKLKRDQNVYNFALDSKKITPVILTDIF